MLFGTLRLALRVNGEPFDVPRNDFVLGGATGVCSSILAFDEAVGAINDDLLDGVLSVDIGVVLCGLSGNCGVALGLFSFKKEVTLRLPS